MNNKTFNIVFWAVALLHLLAIQQDLIWVERLTKPMIVGILIYHYYRRTRLQSSFDKKILAGLIWSWIGDVALMGVGIKSSFFLVGLVAFLIGHIAYITAFREDIKSGGKRPIWVISLAMAYFITHGLLFYIVLYPGLGVLKVPVALYSLIIAVMAILAWMRSIKSSGWGYWLVAIGAWFFVISDTILAVNKFVDKLPNAGLWIMATYILAQYGIATGSIKRCSNKEV